MGFTAPGVELKLRRAKEHLDRITIESTAFIEANLGFTSTKERQHGQQWEIIRWKDIAPVDPMWGTWLGDFTHNVRSGLDQLMFGLVLANGEVPGRHTQYPILGSENEWLAKIVNRDAAADGPAPTAGISDKALAIVKGTQPYLQSRGAHKGQRDPIHQPLMKLVAISNEDKHRTLHVAHVTDLHGPLISYDPPGYLRIVKQRMAPNGGLIRSGAEIGRVQCVIDAEPPAGTEMYVRLRGTAQIVFGKEGQPPLASVRDLAIILQIALAILERFETL